MEGMICWKFVRYYKTLFKIMRRSEKHWKAEITVSNIQGIKWLFVELNTRSTNLRFILKKYYRVFLIYGVPEHNLSPQTRFPVFPE